MGLKSYNGGGGGGGEGGEIVEVQGGHIIRATGRKDRHSKVFTSKGPRDRRVRLSAHTAIQFYDVQDRLGYDRPSKAVDWLIKKAKIAIDKLQISAPAAETTLQESHKPGSSSEPNLLFQHVDTRDNQTQTQTQTETQFETPLMSTNLDAMKTFFPVTTGTSSNINFQSYNPHDDIVSRTSNLSQDLGLSLHPFQGNTSSATTDQSTLFTTPFETNSFGRFYNDLASSEQQRNGFLVNHHQQQPSMITLLNSQQPQLFLGGQQQRGTLQSSFHQFSRSWDHHQQHQHQHNHNHNPTDPNQASVMFASQFGSHSHGMMMQGLSFQSRLHGEGGQAPQPNSSSSPPNSHH